MSGNESPRVLILAGSANDLPKVEPAQQVLHELGVSCELRVASAHRQPDLVATLAAGARERGVQVIICAAGAAAHLAGAVASRTTLPVIGIPISAGPLQGLDALLATVQMPTGVPVATVAIDGARNAALLAAQILALHDPGLAHKLDLLRQQAAQPQPQPGAS